MILSKKHKIYLASGYQRKKEIRSYARQLEEQGYCIISSWHSSPTKASVQLEDFTDKMNQEEAERDLHQIDNASIIMVFTEVPIKRAGHAVEFGYALGSKKPVIVIGPRENVFHYLNRDDYRIYYYENFEKFQERLGKIDQ